MFNAESINELRANESRMTFPCMPFDNPTIEPSTGLYGGWVIKLSEIRFKYFRKKHDAQQWLDNYLTN